MVKFIVNNARWPIIIEEERKCFNLSHYSSYDLSCPLLEKDNFKENLYIALSYYIVLFSFFLTLFVSSMNTLGKYF